MRVLPRLVLPRLVMTRLVMTLTISWLAWLWPLAAHADAPPIELPDWAAAEALEQEAFQRLEDDPGAAGARYLEAASRFEELAPTLGQTAPGLAYWRAARCRWFVGEILPVEERKQRLEQFNAAEDLARRGIEADPECAECMLWKFIAMGRVATNRGLVYGMRGASEMADLLERAIALEPTHRDGEDNSTLGNLHYGSAIFYRVLPDWLWLRWVLGVRGDKERALDHARIALSLHPQRLDYQVEVASQLLCVGTSEDESESLDEGLRILEALRGEPARSLREERQVAAAEIMLEEPAKSCGYTGDAWVEIDERAAAAVAEDD